MNYSHRQMRKTPFKHASQMHPN